MTKYVVARNRPEIVGHVKTFATFYLVVGKPNKWTREQSDATRFERFEIDAKLVGDRFGVTVRS
jgi:hypothetical protein